MSPASVSTKSSYNGETAPLLSSPSSSSRPRIASRGFYDIVSNNDISDISDSGRDSGQLSELVRSHAASDSSDKLGTFFGVFVPCILNVFGAVIFLRLGWITGQAGVVAACGMYFIAYFIATLTVLSLAAIATNGTLKGGGSYFIISRVLGPEFGGAIGVVFYLANVAATGFYMLAFEEALLNTFSGLPKGYMWSFLYGSSVLFLLCLICLVGAKMFARTSFAIFILLWLVILVSFVALLARPPDSVKTFQYKGPSLETLKGNLLPHFVDFKNTKQNFRSVFSLVFPTVSGVLAGSNMSGDLRTPARSIAVGTMSSIVVTLVIYLLLIIVLGLCIPNHILTQGDHMFILGEVVWFPWIVSIGVFCATLSSALATLIGGARILQALARDNLFPFLKVFGKGFGPNDEPRYGVLVTWIFAWLTLFVPNLNDISAPITMFYLLAFTTINLACFLLRVSGAMNFRPSFRYFHWSTALAGFVFSIGLGFYVDAVVTAASVVACMLVWIYVHFKAPIVPWGEITQALMFHQIRKYLLRLDVRKNHVKYWRPNILCLVANPRSSHRTIEFANNLKKGGLLLLGHVVVGDWEDEERHVLNEVRELENIYNTYIAETSFKAFPCVTLANNVQVGVRQLLLEAGLGPLRPNLVMLGLFSYILPSSKPVHHPKSRRPSKLERLATSLDQFPQLRTINHSASTLSSVAYVGILLDILASGKDLLIACGFQTLEKAKIQNWVRRGGTGRCNGNDMNFRNTGSSSGGLSLLGGGESNSSSSKDVDKGKLWIDAWLIDSLISPGHKDATASLLLLLAHALHNSDVWPKVASLRCVTYVEKRCDLAYEYDILQNFVAQVRINCVVHVVCLEDFSEYQYAMAMAPRLASDTSPSFADCDTKQRFSIINAILRSESANTAVVFVPLPLPTSDCTTDRAAADGYISELNLLTSNLPPTLMVDGQSMVMTSDI